MVEVDPVLRNKHRAHLKEAEAKGGPGRACTAPPVTLDVVNRYFHIADNLSGSAREGLLRLLSVINKSNTVGCQPDEVPDAEYLTWLGGVVFEKLEGEARNAAFHALWHVTELSFGRDPNQE